VLFLVKYLSAFHIDYFIYNIYRHWRHVWFYWVSALPVMRVCLYLRDCLHKWIYIYIPSFLTISSRFWMIRSCSDVIPVQFSCNEFFFSNGNTSNHNDSKGDGSELTLNCVDIGNSHKAKKWSKKLEMHLFGLSCNKNSNWSKRLDAELRSTVADSIPRLARNFIACIAKIINNTPQLSLKVICSGFCKILEGSILMIIITWYASLNAAKWP